MVELDDDGRLVWPLRLPSGKRQPSNGAHNFAAILIALAVDGDVEDRKTGQAARKLHGRYTRHFKRLHDTKANLGATGMTPVLRNMEQLGLVKRETNEGGKRTYAIQLAIDADALPAEWFPVSEPEPSEAPEASEEAQDVPEATEPAQEASQAFSVDAMQDRPWLPDLDLAPVDYHALATALLQECVAVMSAPVLDEEKLALQYAGLSAQLSNQHRITDQLKRRVQQLEQELTVRTGHVKALRVELGESQRQLKQADSNVQTMAQQMRSISANFTLDDDQRAAIDRLMRAIPVSANGNSHD